MPVTSQQLRLYGEAIERWLMRPFGAETFVMRVSTRVTVIAAAIGLSFIAQIAIAQIELWLTGQRSLGTRPLARYPAALQFIGGSIFAPLFETLLVQVLGIFIFRRLLRANWTISCVAVGFVFGALHGYGGVMLCKLSISGVLLTGVFVIDKRKRGRPILMTFATHSLYNTILWIA